MSVATLSVQDAFGPRAAPGGTPSTSVRVTPGASPRSGTPTGEAIPGDLGRAFTVAATSNPLYGFVVLAVLLVGLSLLAQRIGSQEEFRNVRLSVFNVLVISLAAIIGINFWKVLFTRFPVPHITPVILAV